MEYVILALKIISIIGLIFIIGENTYLKHEYNKLKESYDKIVGVDKACEKSDYTTFSVSKLDEFENVTTLTQQISDKIAENVAKDLDQKMSLVLIQIKSEIMALPQGEGIPGALDIINKYINFIKK